MIRPRNEKGYTVTELMIVIAIVGVLAFPELEQLRTSAKLTGVQTNFRSVITTIYGLDSTDNLSAELTTVFGNSESPNTEDITNPITNKMGVATSGDLDDEPTAAVYLLDESVTTVPSEAEQSKYKGAVVIVQTDNFVVVYGCDEAGRLMTGLQKTIQL